MCIRYETLSVVDRDLRRKSKFANKYDLISSFSKKSMVNYCCVHGCGRNSRTSKHLYFYSVPKDLNRQEQWLKVAKREDLLEKPQDKRNLYRFCSRHFSPQSIKNKHLCADAVPTLYLPGCEVEDVSDDGDDRPIHSNIACNNCRTKIVGFRYKCVQCIDFDLCSRCEMAEAHENHMMIRIPNPMKFKVVENVVKRWQQLYNDERRNNANDDSSDDEPIQKYAKNYDSGVDLSEDIKLKIRTEVARVMKLKKGDSNNKKKKVTQSPSLQKRPSDTDKISKKQKLYFIDMTPVESAPELVFADVNQIHSVGNSNQILDVKTEGHRTFSKNIEVTDQELPVMNISINDLSEERHLTELMMDVSDQKSFSMF